MRSSGHRQRPERDDFGRRPAPLNSGDRRGEATLARAWAGGTQRPTAPAGATPPTAGTLGGVATQPKVPLMTSVALASICTGWALSVAPMA
jgi:hypothetical protein